MVFDHIPRLCGRPSLAALAIAASAALALAGGATAETRSCAGSLEIRPQNEAMTYLRYDFAFHKEVRLPHEYNNARRDSRARMLSCVRQHWANPEIAIPPDDCTHGREGNRIYEVRNYPFGNLEEELTERLCAVNPEAETILVTVNLTITGERGCVESGSSDTINIVRNFPVNCAAPIGDGGSDEAAEAPPPIGDAGGWECVGEGCDGDAPPADEPPADDPPEDDAPPATATYQPLPAIRLPGNDLYMIELDAPNWLLCRQACTDDARCGAWTYRNPTARSGPLCLIKSRAGLPIPDFCCRSGIKR